MRRRWLVVVAPLIVGVGVCAWLVGGRVTFDPRSGPNVTVSCGSVVSAVEHGNGDEGERRTDACGERLGVRLWLAVLAGVAAVVAAVVVALWIGRDGLAESIGSEVSATWLS